VRPATLGARWHNFVMHSEGRARRRSEASAYNAPYTEASAASGLARYPERARNDDAPLAPGREERGHEVGRPGPRGSHPSTVSACPVIERRDPLRAGSGESDRLGNLGSLRIMVALCELALAAGPRTSLGSLRARHDEVLPPRPGHDRTGPAHEHIAQAG
jgi:hypothetical protein